MILIKTRCVIFTPSKEVKEELLATKISITCYDKDGNIVKRVTSTSGEVEDPEGDSTQNSGGENQWRWCLQRCRCSCRRRVRLMRRY